MAPRPRRLGSAFRGGHHAAAAARRLVAGEPRRSDRKGVPRFRARRRRDCRQLAGRIAGSIRAALPPDPQLAEEKRVPVIAFAEDVAASGGYWLALAGDEIFTEETSLIGSIGVISAGFGFNQLLGRLGIERRLHTAGRRWSLLDPFLPEEPSDVARLTELQQDIHQSFKEHVRRRRAGKIDETDETLFTGDVLTGRMAMDRGLVDGIGELRTVMRTRYGDKVRLRPISAERRRLPFLSRLPFVGCEPASLIAELADWLENAPSVGEVRVVTATLTPVPSFR